MTNVNPLPKSETEKKQKSPFEIVVMGEASRRFKMNMWEQMVGQSKLCSNREAFETMCLVGESAYMEQYHKDNPKATNAKGMWNFRTFLPPAYRTAKSVAANCLEQGVDMTGKGKTACEQEYKAKTAEKQEPKTPHQKAKIVIGTLEKLIPQLDSDGKMDINSELRNLRSLCNQEL